LGANGGGHQRRFTGRPIRWFGVFPPFSSHLEIYKLPGFEFVTTLTSPGRIANFAFSPSGGQLALNSYSGVELYETSRWTRFKTLPDYIALLPTPDGKNCFLTTDYRTSALHDAGSLAEILPLPPGTLPLALSGDGRYLAATFDSCHLQLWDLSDVRGPLAQLGLTW
jgi:WD40 repeat protein